MITHLKHGPFLRAIGWVGGRDRAVQSRPSSQFNELTPLVHLAHGASPVVIDPMSREDMLAALPPTVLKGSGVARARSATKSTVLAALLSKELAPYISNLPNFDGKRVGLAVVTSSAIVPVFWRFESVGVSESWDHTDTMLLPASIPSGVVTAASTVTDFHATAVTLGEGAVGMVSAIELAHLNFVHDRADHFLVVASEEASETMLDAMAATSRSRSIVDGSAGYVLSKERLAPEDWQIAFYGTQSLNQTVDLPEDWSDAHVFRVVMEGPFSLYTSNLLPVALVAALNCQNKKAVLEFELPGASTSFVGFRRQAAT